jgi:hypothetical protein
LFAALNAANGEVYGLCQERHRHQEWLTFLRLLDQSMPAHLDLHLIGDNYATHRWAIRELICDSQNTESSSCPSDLVPIGFDM